MNIYNSIVDLHVPGCVKRVKSLLLPKWMDKSILASIRTRDRLKKSATNAASLLEYKTYRNKATFQIKNKSDSKMPWKVLKSASNSGTKGSLLPSMMTHVMLLSPMKLLRCSTCTFPVLLIPYLLKLEYNTKTRTTIVRKFWIP